MYNSGTLGKELHAYFITATPSSSAIKDLVSRDQLQPELVGHLGGIMHVQASTTG